MREIVRSIEGEYRRQKKTAEGAIAQVAEEQLARAIGAGGNSLATFVWHISGNLRSRFTDLLRGVALQVYEALHRSFAHTSHHVGQVVLLARALRGADWSYLTIPPGGSAAYDAKPRWREAPLPVNVLPSRSVLNE